MPPCRPADGASAGRACRRAGTVSGWSRSRRRSRWPWPVPADQSEPSTGRISTAGCDRIREARQLLHGLGVGPVGDQRGAVRAAANDARTPGTRELSAAGDPTATLLEKAAELVVGVVDGLVVGLGALVPLCLTVGGEQDDVIGHGASSRCGGSSHWGDGRMEVSSTLVPEPVPGTVPRTRVHHDGGWTGTQKRQVGGRTHIGMMMRDQRYVSVLHRLYADRVRLCPCS
jgi:hypothetical protein